MNARTHEQDTHHKNQNFIQITTQDSNHIHTISHIYTKKQKRLRKENKPDE